ncbi:MAG: NAD(P)/FAD-dependent oxidoreductase, partial [Eubacteriales bacterium]|nr:NAD(P)/FAD-dependent oxidoreductase [Eubacteriales bacterium]
RDAEETERDETLWIRTRYLVIASAGLAAEDLGSGRKILKKLARSHRFSHVAPGLVALRCQSLSPRLSGLRVRARLHYGALPNLHLSERGEILFCDYGISGIAAMDLSSRIASGDDEGGLQSYLEPRVLQYCRQRMNSDGEAFLFLELFPDSSRAELCALLRPRIYDATVPCGLRESLGYLFSGILDQSLLEACIDRFFEIYYAKAGSVRLQSHSDLDVAVEQFIRFLSCLPMEYEGVRDYRYAQIMVGGVLLSEIDDCFESRVQSGLFLGGEILDMQGRCGGFNLQWMLISASHLAPKIAQRLASSADAVDKKT